MGGDDSMKVLEWLDDNSLILSGYYHPMHIAAGEVIRNLGAELKASRARVRGASIDLDEANRRADEAEQRISDARKLLADAIEDANDPDSVAEWEDIVAALSAALGASDD